MCACDCVFVYVGECKCEYGSVSVCAVCRCRRVGCVKKKVYGVYVFMRIEWSENLLTRIVNA